jgi:hypothetical protein
MAAEGAVAPRPVEQLGLLALLSADPDPEVRATAERTLARLPASQVAPWSPGPRHPPSCASSSTRGLAAAAAAGEPDAPLLDTDDTDYGPEEQSPERRRP